MDSIFITGATGLLGSNLALRLCKDYRVVCLIKDKNYRLRKDLVDKVSIVYGDIRDFEAVRYCMSRYEIDTVFHLAATTIIQQSTVDPLTTYSSNILGTLNVLEAIRQMGNRVKKSTFASCYDKKTRAYTKQGLKYYYDLLPTDEVLTINPETECLEYSTINEIVIDDYDDNLITFKGKSLDLAITPNHRMLTRYKDKLELIPANSYLSTVGWERPLGHWKSNETINLPQLPEFHWNVKDNLKENFDVNNFLYLMGIFIGDGCIEEQQRITESKTGLSAKEFIIKGRNSLTGQFQSISKKENSTDIIISKSNMIYLYIPEKDGCRSQVEKTLDILGIEYTKWIHDGEGAIYFSSAKLVHWFKDCGHLAENKCVPSWVKNLPKEQLEFLLRGIIDSDGSDAHPKNPSITTISTQLVNDIIELSIKCGWYPTFTYEEAPLVKPIIKGRQVNSKGCFRISLSKRLKSIRPLHKSYISYNDKVWCLRLTKNKNFLVERNGKLAFSGNSDKSYGTSPILPYKEEMPMMASDPYSTSKACSDLIVRSHVLTYGLNACVIRAGNIYGPDLNKTRLIPRSIVNLLQGKAPVIYKGVGEYRREWLYVDDIIDAYLTVHERGTAGEAYNVGGSGFINIFDAVDLITKACGSNIKPEIIDNQFLEIKEQWLDSTKLQSLGWKCKYNLEQGLIPTVAWYREYLANKSNMFFGNG